MPHYSDYPPPPTAFGTGAISVPQDTPLADLVQVALDLEAMLLCAWIEAGWCEGFETYTCQLGLTSGGCN